MTMAQSPVDRPELQQDGPALEPAANAGPAGTRARLNIDTMTPVSHNGCFEFDRVIKSGYVDKRTSKTKVRL